MIDALLSGRIALDGLRPDPTFGIGVPASVPGVPDRVLQPKSTWEDGSAYDAQAKRLARMFLDNFGRYGDEVSAEIRAVAPRPG